MLFKISIRVCLILLMGLASCSTSNRESRIQSWKRNRDVKLLYLKPADNWTAGLPIGNGILGAMVLGGIEQELQPGWRIIFG